MATPFDPRKILKQISNSLLKEFFARRKVLLDLPWETLKETDMEIPFAAWQALPDEARQEIQIALHELTELEDQRGLAVIAEEIRRFCPERLVEWSAFEGRLDKCMWFYLNMPEFFKEVTLFTRTDAQSQGRYSVRRDGLPTGVSTFSPQMQEGLQKALRDYYWANEMRGQYCEVQHYSRPGKAEYFFTHSDDWPDRLLVFGDDGKMTPRSGRYAFSNVFVYCPDDGSLEVIAKGGKKVHLPLQQAFCKAIFNLDVGPADPLRAVYRLDMLLDPAFRLVTEPEDGVKHARLARIRLVPVSSSYNVDYFELKFPPWVGRSESLEKVLKFLAACDLTPEQILVKQASFQIQCMKDRSGRERKLTFDVSAPNSCNLKSRGDNERVIGERCLRRWGVTK